MREKARQVHKRIRKTARSYAKYTVAGLAALMFLSVVWLSVYSHELSEEERIWFQISFLLLAAILAELLVVYLKQPMVMILLMVGIIISPSAIEMGYPLLYGILSSIASAFPGLYEFVRSVFAIGGIDLSVAKTIPHIVPKEGMVEIFAQLGSIILLFKVGLHSEIHKIFNKRNFIVALAGIILPFVGGYFYAEYTHPGNLSYALFLGAALTATSVGVTVAVLEEFKVLHREFSKVILGAAVIDDILSLLVLSVVKNIPETLTVETLSPLASVFALALIFVAGGIKLGQYVVRRYFDDCCNPEGEIPNATFLGMLVFMLSYAYVAEFIGLSAIVGAFLAGVTLNYSRAIDKIFKLFYPLEAFFTPIFFISLGMFVDIAALMEYIGPIIIISLIAVATKVVACGFATRFTGGDLKESVIVGVGMVPRGEVALIIGLYGLKATTAAGVPVLDTAQYSIIASMAFLTTVIVPAVMHRIMKYEGYRGAEETAGMN